MKTVHFVIDDKPVIAREGTNIFQAALDNGISIPGLCYHPKLSQFGGCRLCYVEVTERKRVRHRFACAHPVSEGMQVKVYTPKVVHYRKAVMEYLLAHHELSCPTCDKSGECGLQNITYELNLPPGRFRTVRMNYPIVRDNPVLELNRNRCILCGRCVSACREIEGVSAIDFQNRGFKTVIGTAFDRPLECSFCGTCVAVCPTGAWQDRTLRFRGRPWEFTLTPTICPYCAVGCTVVLNTKSGTVRRVTSDDNAGINEGNLCVKGRFGHEFIHSDERIKTPLVKKKGVLVPVSWDEAIDIVSKRFQEILAAHGGMSIGGIGSEKCTNEDNYLFQKFCRSVLGTNAVDNISNMKAPYLNELIYKSVIHRLSATSLKDIENADTLFFFGADIAEAHPVVGCMARKASRLNKANLIVANIRDITFNSAARNEIRLQYSLGTQMVLIMALIKIIIDERLIDVDRVEVSTGGFHALRTQLDQFNLEQAAQLTGVPEAALRNAARLLTRPGNCCIVCGKDVEEDPLGEKTILCLMNLCAMVNAAYHENTSPVRISILFSRTNNNSQGVNDMGVVPGFFPGYLSTGEIVNRKRFEGLWGLKFPQGYPEKEYINVIDQVLTGTVKAVYIMGENPVITYPNGKVVMEAFKKLEFLVVQDVFLTQTALMADVVLPVVTFAEKEGTFTNMGMTVQRLNRAVTPVRDAKPDWQIICELAQKMGYPYLYGSSQEVLSEIENIVPIYAGINYDRLKRREFNWVSSIYGKGGPEKYSFTVIQPETVNIVKRNDFPFILLTGYSLNHLGTFSSHSKALTQIAPEGFVALNREDAESLNIRHEDTVIIESVQDTIKVKARVTKKVPKGTVFVPEDYEWIPVNRLRNKAYTPVRIYKEPEGEESPGSEISDEWIH